MGKHQEATKLLTRLLLMFVLSAHLLETARALSNKRLCADENCKGIISLGTGKINYRAGEEGMISFMINSKIKVKSKSAGDDLSLWGIEVNGREGYAPKNMIKEDRILISEKNLKYIVDVEKKQKIPDLSTSEKPLESSTLEKTTTKPLNRTPTESAESVLNNSSNEKFTAESSPVVTPVISELADRTNVMASDNVENVSESNMQDKIESSENHKDKVDVENPQNESYLEQDKSDKVQSSKISQEEKIVTEFNVDNEMNPNKSKNDEGKQEIESTSNTANNENAYPNEKNISTPTEVEANIGTNEDKQQQSEIKDSQAIDSINLESLNVVGEITIEKDSTNNEILSNSADPIVSNKINNMLDEAKDKPITENLPSNLDHEKNQIDNNYQHVNEMLKLRKKKYNIKEDKEINQTENTFNYNNTSANTENSEVPKDQNQQQTPNKVNLDNTLIGDQAKANLIKETAETDITSEKGAQIDQPNNKSPTLPLETIIKDTNDLSDISFNKKNSVQDSYLTESASNLPRENDKQQGNEYTTVSEPVLQNAGETEKLIAKQNYYVTETESISEENKNYHNHIESHEKNTNDTLDKQFSLKNTKEVDQSKTILNDNQQESNMELDSVNTIDNIKSFPTESMPYYNETAFNTEQATEAETETTKSENISSTSAQNTDNAYSGTIDQNTESASSQAEVVSENNSTIALNPTKDIPSQPEVVLESTNPTTYNTEQISSQSEIVSEKNNPTTHNPTEAILNQAEVVLENNKPTTHNPTGEQSSQAEIVSENNNSITHKPAEDQPSQAEAVSEIIKPTPQNTEEISSQSEDVSKTNNPTEVISSQAEDVLGNNKPTTHNPIEEEHSQLKFVSENNNPTTPHPNEQISNQVEFVSENINPTISSQEEMVSENINPTTHNPIETPQQSQNEYTYRENIEASVPSINNYVQDFEHIEASIPPSDHKENLPSTDSYNTISTTSVTADRPTDQINEEQSNIITSLPKYEPKENQGLFATIMGTVNNMLNNNKKKQNEFEGDSELDRILYPDGNINQNNNKENLNEGKIINRGEIGYQYCKNIGPNGECPDSSENDDHSASHIHDVTSYLLFGSDFTLDDFLKTLASKVIEMSELLAFLVIAAAASLFFLFGYYCFCNSSREGGLLLKLNQLESSLLTSHKENAILKQNLLSTRHKLASIEDNSFGSNDMVVSLKKELEVELLEKGSLQEQITVLQKELENAADAGIELNKIVSELLSNQTGDESIISSVEELQKQLNEQQNTIYEINASLAEKSRENSELQLLIAEHNARYETELAHVQRDNDELEHEKGNLLTRLEEMKIDFDKDITAALEGKNLEIKRLQNEILDLNNKLENEHTKWQTSVAKIEALEECLKNIRRDPKVNINEVINVANVKAQLIETQKVNKSLKEKLETELDSRKLAENQLETITGEVEKLKQDFNQSEKDKLEAQTRLEVLSNYFKDKENQLQKELSLKEAMWLKQQGETTTTVDRVTAMQEEIQSLKSQNDSLRAEIEAQVAAHKAQTGTLENRAHETWLAARQSDRRYEEARAEATALRRKLTALAGVNVNEPNKVVSVGPAAMGDELTQAPSPIHMESPGSPLLGRMPPPPFLPLPFMGPPPPFMGMPPPPPFVPPGEMRPAPLGRIMSPPPQRSGRFSPQHLDYEDYLDYDSNNTWHRQTYSPPPRTYRSLSPTDSRYNYGNERDIMSKYDTETDFSPPPSPRETRRRVGNSSERIDSSTKISYGNTKKFNSSHKGPFSSGSDKSSNTHLHNDNKPKKGNGGKNLV